MSRASKKQRRVFKLNLDDHVPEGSQVAGSRVNRTRDPSPEEIKIRAAAIRRGWSNREKERRKTWIKPTWLPPLLEHPRVGDARSGTAN